MTWAVLVGNIKGGTGKSTISEQVARRMQERDYDVGVLDADIDSANLGTRMGSTERVEFEGDHVIQPVDADGIKLYSMENAFDDAAFSQSGSFMASVVKDMVQSSNWGDLDYLIVDCPPGSSDVFEELVRALRQNLLGAISVGTSDAYDDTARFVQVCNHEWIPILSFVENMSGLYCHGEEVMCEDEDHPVKPFGEGKIEEFAEGLGGNFAGKIPLCTTGINGNEIAVDTVDSIADSIVEADQPELPEDNLGDKSFIRNVWSSISGGLKQINDELPVEKLQSQFGVEDREPLVVEIELTDAGVVSGIFDTVIITIDEGNFKALRPGKAKRKGIQPEGGVKITSQDLSYAMNGEKKVMRSVTGEVITEPYSIIDAVKMGDAEVWGDKTINRLAVLDRILSEVVPMKEVQEIMTT